MPAKESLELVKRAFTSLGEQDLSPTRELVRSEAFESFSRDFAMVQQAFPDLRISVEDQIAADDKVVTRWIARGTHQGEGTLPGVGTIRPTGQQVEIQGITIHQIQDGKIVETWGVTEKLEPLIKLGIVKPRKRFLRRTP